MSEQRQPLRDRDVLRRLRELGRVQGNADRAQQAVERAVLTVSRQTERDPWQADGPKAEILDQGMDHVDDDR